MPRRKWIRQKVVPENKVDAIVEAIRLAPTSSGTQPFELIVVANSEIRSKKYYEHST